mgnify:CR=1 FL=1
MLKRFFKGMLGIAVMSLTLASCTKAPNEVVETLTVTPDAAISFLAKENSEVVLKVVTNADSWKATPTADWIVLVPDMEKGNLHVNAKDNNTTEQRVARIRIEAGLARPVAINVVQAAGTGEVTPEPSEGVAVKLVSMGETTIATKTETELSVKVKLSVTAAAASDVEVKLFYDEGYLREYNYINKEQGEAVLYPKEKVTIPADGKMVIKAGQTESEEVEVKLDATGLSMGSPYLLPLYLKAVENAAVKQAECRVNVLVRKQNPKQIKNVVYFEVNDCNPLNALEYELADGTPFFDAVILFAANINFNRAEDVVYLSNNPNVQALLDDSEIYLQPLRKKGIKVYLGLLGNHDAAGLCQLSDWGAQQWAQEVAEACKTYKLDGVNLDDEYSSSPDLSNKWFAPRSAAAGARLCYELKKALKATCPWETEVSTFAYGQLYTLPTSVKDLETNEDQPISKWLDFHVANYGGTTSPYGDLTKAQCSGMSLELNRGYGSITEDSARNMKNQGYGWCMWFAFDPSGTGTVNSNRYRSDGFIKAAAKGFYDQELKEPTGVWNKIGEGKYDPNRHTR